MRGRRKPRRKSKLPILPAVKKILDRAWEFQSKLIRYEAKGICRTCGSKHEPLSKGTNAGHMIHTGNGYSQIDFNFVLEAFGLPANIYCQCVRCNMYESGQRDIMLREFLRDGHTVEDYDRLTALKLQVWDPTIEEAVAIRDHYKEACRDAGIKI